MQDTIINGCYHIKEKTNETPFTINWLAQSLFSGYKVILKFLKKTNQDFDQEALTQFKQEILKLIQLYHTDMEKIIELEIQDGYTYVTTEQIQGYRLRKLKSIKKNLAIHDILFIIIRLCKALDYAHRNGIIHRNLNLDNIWVITNFDQIYSTKITEFGFWRIGRLFPPGEFKADADFMAPEVIENNSEAIGIPSDIYAIGSILYWLLTDKIPFKSLKEKKDSHFYPELPSVLNGQCPPLLDLILLKMLQKDPAARYQATDLLLADIVTLYAQQIKNSQAAEALLKQQNSNEPIAQPVRQFTLPVKKYKEIVGNKDSLTAFLGNSSIGEAVLKLTVMPAPQIVDLDAGLANQEALLEHDIITEGQAENKKQEPKKPLVQDQNAQEPVTRENVKNTKTDPETNSIHEVIADAKRGQKAIRTKKQHVKKRSLEKLLTVKQKKNPKKSIPGQNTSVIKLTPTAARPRWLLKRFRTSVSWLDFLKNQFYQLFKFKGNVLLIEYPKEDDPGFSEDIKKLTSFYKDSLHYNHGHSIILELNPGTTNYSLLYFLLNEYIAFLHENLKKQKEEIMCILERDFPSAVEMWMRMQPATKTKFEAYQIAPNDNKEIEASDLKNDFVKLLRSLKDFNYLFLLIRNLHYLDKGSLTLLEYGVSQIIRLPIFIVGLYEAKDENALSEPPAPEQSA